MMPIIFPVVIEHHAVMQRLGLKPEDIDSAGFVHFGTDAKGKPIIQCSGRSNSLKLDSKPERDSKLCTRLCRDPFWDD
jgi:hypothetical protein